VRSAEAVGFDGEKNRDCGDAGKSELAGIVGGSVFGGAAEFLRQGEHCFRTAGLGCLLCGRPLGMSCKELAAIANMKRIRHAASGIEPFDISPIAAWLQAGGWESSAFRVVCWRTLTVLRKKFSVDACGSSRFLTSTCHKQQTCPKYVSVAAKSSAPAPQEKRLTHI